ncbi:hypothetical protein FSP39_011246 [Pinctada imbricata]|uniref:WAP domain-containing protein n=1 Tax=Pinctada imbricata TaxID=66713 RepID=A0AA88YIR8_PINIB|nr:hypothetical protein FSP39_011246 [Pinctada imbricata]
MSHVYSNFGVWAPWSRGKAEYPRKNLLGLGRYTAMLIRLAALVLLIQAFGSEGLERQYGPPKKMVRPKPGVCLHPNSLRGGGQPCIHDVKCPGSQKCCEAIDGRRYCAHLHDTHPGGPIGGGGGIIDPLPPRIRDPLTERIREKPGYGGKKPGYVDPIVKKPGYGGVKNPISGPGYVDPIIKDPIVEPGYVDPIVKKPGYGKPGYVDPVVKNPIVEPGYVDPVVKKPGYWRAWLC